MCVQLSSIHQIYSNHFIHGSDTSGQYDHHLANTKAIRTRTNYSIYYDTVLLIFSDVCRWTTPFCVWRWMRAYLRRYQPDMYPRMCAGLCLSILPSDFRHSQTEMRNISRLQHCPQTWYCVSICFLVYCISFVVQYCSLHKPSIILHQSLQMYISHSAFAVFVILDSTLHFTL